MAFEDKSQMKSPSILLIKLKTDGLLLIIRDGFLEIVVIVLPIMYTGDP